MKTKIILSLAAFVVMASVFGQKPAVTLTFTADYNNTSEYMQLDSIKVTNISQGVDTVLFYPDTVLVLEYSVNIPGNIKQDEGFRVIQNCPNPVTDQTMISIFIPEKDIVEICVSDVRGRPLLKSDWQLERGYHSYSFTSGDRGMLFFTATWKGINSTIKLLSEGTGNRGNALVYAGFLGTGLTLKSNEKALVFAFNPGDSLLYIGYAETSEGINGSDVLGDRPQSDKTYLFEIVEGIPCPGIPVINYGGQTYTTVQIGSQCWMAENLNIGARINGSQGQTDNSIIEKYCYYDLESNCDIYGGLYQWNELMQYVNTEGAQGICPTGWHLPTDAEWTTLTTYLGGTSVAGGKMKSTGTIEAGTGLWYDPNAGATNESGFTALPGGYRANDGYFYYMSNSASFWSSSEFSSTHAWCRILYYSDATVHRNHDLYTTSGYSGRCVKD